MSSNKQLKTMNIYHVYVLSLNNDVKLIATNFKAIYETLKKYKKKLKIEKMQAYVTLVGRVREGAMLSFATTDGNHFFIVKRVVIQKTVHIA